MNHGTFAIIFGFLAIAFSALAIAEPCTSGLPISVWMSGMTAGSSALSFALWLGEKFKEPKT